MVCAEQRLYSFSWKLLFMDSRPELAGEILTGVLELKNNEWDSVYLGNEAEALLSKCNIYFGQETSMSNQTLSP